MTGDQVHSDVKKQLDDEAAKRKLLADEEAAELQKTREKKMVDVVLKAAKAEAGKGNQR
ncbi:MAG: hypothetical protein H6908_04195 [Hyphomicrobiales bacterium]|nr:hypothetical protein [Hyphomicrobiales bacterium]